MPQMVSDPIRFRLPRASVRRNIACKMIEAAMAKAKWTAAHTEQAKALRAQGVSVLAISKQMRYSPSHVHSKLAEAGVDGRPVWTETDTRIALRLQAEGLAATRIGALLGWHESTVREHLHRAGVGPRTQKKAPCRWSDAHTTEAKSLIAEGVSKAEIARRSGFSISTIYRALAA